MSFLRERKKKRTRKTRPEADGATDSVSCNCSWGKSIYYHFFYPSVNHKIRKRPPFWGLSCCCSQLLSACARIMWIHLSPRVDRIRSSDRKNSFFFFFFFFFFCRLIQVILLFVIWAGMMCFIFFSLLPHLWTFRGPRSRRKTGQNLI